MHFKLGLILFLLSNSAVYSEEVDGPANFRDSPKGNIIVSLNDGVEVIPLEYNNYWYKVEIPIYIKKEKVRTFTAQNPNDGYVVPNSLLYDHAGRVIGSVKKKTAFNFGSLEEVDMYYGAIVLYTFHKNIKPHTLVEKNIEKLLSNNVHLLKNGWSEFVDPPNYQAWLSHNKFRSFIYFDPLSLNINPSPRVILFFYNKKLFSMLLNKDINNKYFTSSSKSCGYTIQYLPGFNENIKKDFDSFYPHRICVAN